MRILARAASGLVLIAGLALVLGYVWLRGSLPTIDGSLTVSGIQAPVEIRRDAHGISHIEASSEADAYFGLGFVHAQDRLWQMDVGRRAGAGRLSEIFGERTLSADRYLRTLGFNRVAERNLNHFSDRGGRLLEAYAAGVNAALRQRSGPLPPEYVVFRTEPLDWRPVDSILNVKMMALQLGGNANAELLRRQLNQVLSPAQLAAMWPDVKLGSAASEIDAQLIKRTAAAFASHDVGTGGSNNWAIAGHRSASGSPVVANDPHLPHSAPGAWYLVHLTAPGLNVAGATLPGIPVIIVGRNEHAAWGVTNTETDVQDVFVERVDPDDPSRYLTPDGPVPFEIRTEVIEVKDGDPVTIEVRETRHGPVMSDVSDRYHGAVSNGEVMALAWTALDEDDASLEAGFAMARARTWDDLRSALRDFQSPQQNFVGADTEGTIGFIAAGRVPIRKSGQGWLPAAGWTGNGDWVDRIPFDQLPQSINPPSGVIITANQDVTPPGYPHFISHDWAPSYRADRIAALLETRDRWAGDQFTDVQTDDVSLFARQFLPVMLPALTGISNGRAAARLADWDGIMARDAAEPLIFQAWYRAVTQRLYADELGPLFDRAWGRRPAFIYHVLTADPTWCDDITTDETESCEDQLRDAYHEALEWLMVTYGKSINNWQWGEAHGARNSHKAFTNIPVLGYLFDIDLPHGGGPYTVMQANTQISNHADPFGEIHGASLRVIFDLAEPDRNLVMITTGQSGNRFSQWYDDLSTPWANGNYIELPLSADGVARVSKHILRLEPSGTGS